MTSCSISLESDSEENVQTGRFWTDKHPEAGRGGRGLSLFSDIEVDDPPPLPTHPSVETGLTESANSFSGVFIYSWRVSKEPGRRLLATSENDLLCVAAAPSFTALVSNISPERSPCQIPPELLVFCVADQTSDAEFSISAGADLAHSCPALQDSTSWGFPGRRRLPFLFFPPLLL